MLKRVHFVRILIWINVSDTFSNQTSRSRHLIVQRVVVVVVIVENSNFFISFFVNKQYFRNDNICTANRNVSLTYVPLFTHKLFLQHEGVEVSQ